MEVEEWDAESICLAKEVEAGNRFSSDCERDKASCMSVCFVVGVRESWERICGKNFF